MEKRYYTWYRYGKPWKLVRSSKYFQNIFCSQVEEEDKSTWEFVYDGLFADTDTRAISSLSTQRSSFARYLSEHRSAHTRRPQARSSRMATVAAPLPLRAAACAGHAPFRLSSDDGARFPSRLGQRRLVAGGCRPRESAGFRVEALFGGGGGGGPKEPMVPPYNVLITGSTKGAVNASSFFASASIGSYGSTYWNEWKLSLKLCKSIDFISYFGQETEIKGYRGVHNL
jgi:hypothetical protein